MNEPFITSFSSSKLDEVLSTQKKNNILIKSSTIVILKSRTYFVFFADKREIQFIDIYGRRFRMKNASEAEVYICEQLHKAITIEDVFVRAQLRYPNLAKKSVYRLLHLLLERAIIERIDTSYTPEISEEAMKRYDRQLRFFSIFTHKVEDRFRMQSALSQATVTIFGLGGVGNWVASHLGATGIGHLRLVDDNIVEYSNLNRQALYTPDNLGKQKVEIAASRLKSFNPDVEVQAFPLKITSPEDIKRVIDGATIAVLAADEPEEIRHWMAVACSQQRIPYIQGSLHAYFLQIGPLYHVPYTGCYACRQIRLAENQDYTARLEAYRRSPQGIPPLIGPLCGFVGSAVALEIARYISKYQLPCTFGRYYCIDARTWKTWVEEVPHHDKCPVCGPLLESISGSMTQT